MSSIGLPGSATFAESYSGIEEILEYLPDNTGNQISAQIVRNAVYTLYEEIQAASASEFLYSNSNEISNPIGNWYKDNNAGWKGTFSNVTLTELFNGIFYKDSGPSVTLSIGAPSLNDFKLNQSQEPDRKLTFAASKGTFELVGTAPIKRGTSTIATVGIPVNGHLVPDSITVSVPFNTNSTWRIDISDIKGNTAFNTAGIVYSLRFFWGTVATRNSIIGSASINALPTSGFNGTSTNITNGVLLSNPNKPSAQLIFSGIGGGGRYICWAFPSAWGEPKFTQFGGSEWGGPTFSKKVSYVNTFGHATDYDIYETQSSYGSSLAQIEMKF